MDTRLVVKVQGTVLESNFSQYKEEILAKIADIKTDLITDNDFSDAKNVIVLCKEAETHIDLSREYALEDAGELATLINDMAFVRQELRNTRLELNTKVKTEEHRRRSEIITGGKQVVCEFLEKQNPIIRNMSIDLNPIHESAKGKRGIAGVSRAVDETVLAMIEEIKDTCKRVGENDLIFGTIAHSHKAIFPDKNRLIFLPELEMVEIIEGRIAKADLEEKEREKVAGATNSTECPWNAQPTINTDKYQAVIDLKGDTKVIKAIYSELKILLADYDEVITANLIKT